jgi:hypothetical protein
MSTRDTEYLVGLRHKIDGLETALFIAREAERNTKERLSSVSEQLIGAHQEIDRLRNQITLIQATSD